VKTIANLSVAISTVDRPEALARCLDALLSGDVLPAEVIIVDQSTNGATKAVIEQRSAGIVPLLYTHQQRRGLSASRNAAFARASCPVIAVTDDDCVPDPGWIAAIEQTFASSNAPHALTGRVLPLGPEIPETFAVATRTNTLQTEFSGKASPWLIGGGNNFAVKLDWFTCVGGCDERLGVGSPGKAAEDIDLFYRLLRAGARILYEPDALVYHQRQSKTQRVASRWSYGYGVGAFCSMWLRRGDLYALRVLGHWLSWQCWHLALTTGRLQWPEAYQRCLSLQGTGGGLMYGMRVRRTA
jgi:GT2 family glycosyltransferase